MSFFHTVKKTAHSVMNKENIPKDAEWESIKAQHAKVLDLFETLKRHVQQQVDQTRAYGASSLQLASDFQQLAEADPTQNDFVNLASRHNAFAKDLNGRVGQGSPVLSAIESNALSKLNEHVNDLQALKKQVAERDELFTELAYYKSKVADLRKSGSSEKAKDVERRERNEAKERELNANFMNKDEQVKRAIRQATMDGYNLAHAVIKDVLQAHAAFGEAVSIATQNVDNSSVPVSSFCESGPLKDAIESKQGGERSRQGSYY